MSAAAHPRDEPPRREDARGDEERATECAMERAIARLGAAPVDQLPPTIQLDGT